MSENAYQTGRLDLPFVGHCTFAKSPVCTDWNAIDADVAVIGVPNDMGPQWRPGARFGPRAIREASTLFSFGHGGAYDHEDDVLYLCDGHSDTKKKGLREGCRGYRLCIEARPSPSAPAFCATIP